MVSTYTYFVDKTISHSRREETPEAKRVSEKLRVEHLRHKLLGYEQKTIPQRFDERRTANP